MQTSLEFCTPCGQVPDISSDPRSDVRGTLENYIAVCGLVAFKDFFMKVKYGQINNIPESVTKTEYLALCREVFQNRAGRVERHKGRSKFFKIKNANKKAKR
jgi:hypothetical protein